MSTCRSSDYPQAAVRYWCTPYVGWLIPDGMTDTSLVIQDAPADGHGRQPGRKSLRRLAIPGRVVAVAGATRPNIWHTAVLTVSWPSGRRFWSGSVGSITTTPRRPLRSLNATLT